MSDDQLKHISIRGVNSDVYDQFSNKVKELDMNIGEALSKMMADVVKDFDETFPEVSSKSLAEIAGLRKSSIQHQRSLTVSKQDLEDAGQRYSFQHIRNLVFAEDVDKDTFQKYVSSIQHCRVVRIPDVLPKLQILSMISHCDNVDTYSADDGLPETLEDE